ncbi:MAG: hypothetical protein ACHQYQ_04405, partial [Bacteriovoracales bacterium]
APVLILAPPIFDTCLVFYLRMRRGLSPFLGSKDHFPLRLEQRGWSRKQILIFSIMITAIFGFSAYIITQSSFQTTIATLALLLILMGIFINYIMKATPQ